MIPEILSARFIDEQKIKINKYTETNIGVKMAPKTASKRPSEGLE